MITLIAAIGRNNEIGYNNKLLWSIPEDMKHFKEYTTDKVVIMGRKTFDSIGRALPGRKNVILTSSPIPNLLCVNSVESAMTIEHCYPEMVVIGGETVYKQTIDLASKLVITHVDAAYIADAYFPKIDLAKWELASTIISHTSLFEYKFCEYIRKIR
jgi:dihydrofolate reductase